jgi:hypothetical protein
LLGSLIVGLFFASYVALDLRLASSELPGWQGVMRARCTSVVQPESGSLYQALQRLIALLLRGAWRGNGCTHRPRAAHVCSLVLGCQQRWCARPSEHHTNVSGQELRNAGSVLGYYERSRLWLQVRADAS